jgi:hypothetical protein
MRRSATRDRYDEQRDEVELCTTLWIASSGTDRSLTQAEVDRLLGVRVPGPAAGTPAAPQPTAW